MTVTIGPLATPSLDQSISAVINYLDSIPLDDIKEGTVLVDSRFSINNIQKGENAYSDIKYSSIGLSGGSYTDNMDGSETYYPPAITCIIQFENLYFQYFRNTGGYRIVTQKNDSMTLTQTTTPTFNGYSFYPTPT